MRNVQKLMGCSGALFYGLFFAFLAHAQEADDPAKLPAAIQRSELDATSSIASDVDDLAVAAEKAFKNEAAKDIAQLTGLGATPSAEPTRPPELDDSLPSIEADEKSLEAQAEALRQEK